VSLRRPCRSVARVGSVARVISVARVGSVVRVGFVFSSSVLPPSQMIYSRMGS